MFDPIAASQEIRASYIDYITTTFHMADEAYKKEFRKELEREGAAAKGPFLDIGGSYETGKTLRELVREGAVSPLFERLEPVPEKDRELKLDRPLYRHQEEALRKATQGQNLVITTGTGSGKTESFLLPILQHLLREEEEGGLDHGVRAIIIYPMNALANDQMKRMRALLKNYPQIRYGVYNGNTEHSQSQALIEYRRTYRDPSGNPLDPAPNEVISREVMQSAPPHILITNYSMLEYMMVRPKDDRVFSGAKLKYIVLDEAHIYKGATGMETSLLMRRLRARISQPGSVQYILTSATLGGPEANDSVLEFAERLSGVAFSQQGIIRAQEKNPPMQEFLEFPPQLFEELQNAPQETAAILERYQADFAPQGEAEEKLYWLCLHSKLFAALRKAVREPVTVAQLQQALSRETPMTLDQVTAFVDVCARAELDGASLIKPRYHFFVRALEGAYLTLTSPKRLFLHRKESWDGDGDPVRVFEAAVCTDCGRLAIVGEEQDGFLRQSAYRGGEERADYFYLSQSADEELLEEDEGDEEPENGEPYLLCALCGAIAPEADVRMDKQSLRKHFCDHPSNYWVKVWKAPRKPGKPVSCPACGFGHLRRIYLGSEAATAVLATQLYEQLPGEEVTVVSKESRGGKRSVFSKGNSARTVRVKKARQFLCFSDSRSEAAFFASYLERSYQEFLRRRGIWHVAEHFREQGRASVSVEEFVNELARFYEGNRCFADWDEPRQDSGLLASVSRNNAWLAVLNEMFNARRSTSLVTMGVISFEYIPNDDVVSSFEEAYDLPAQSARGLLELLVQDGVFTGALDTGSSYTLTAAEREYVFFSPVAKKLVLMRTAEDAKRTWVSGWRGRKRTNGTFYPNSRLLRLTRALGISMEDADELLADYWESVLCPGF